MADISSWLRWVYTYCQISYIRRTQLQKLNVSHLVLQLSLPDLLKPCVKLRMEMQLEQRRQVMLKLHLSDQQFDCLKVRLILEILRYLDSNAYMYGGSRHDWLRNWII